MQRRFKLICLTVLLAATATLVLNAQEVTDCCSGEDHHHEEEVTQLAFVENGNQWHPAVKYAVNLGAYNKAFVQENALAFQWLESDPDKHTHEFVDKIKQQTDPDLRIKGHKYTVKFLGASADEIIGLDRQEGYLNYMIGNDRSKWASRVGRYHGTRHRDLYNGIDMVTYSAEGHLKYDFLVQAGSDPSLIAMQYKGVEGLYIDTDGALVIPTSVDTIREYIPTAYQEIAGKRRPVSCEYQLEAGTVRFTFPNGYDPAHDLVIDPTVIGATLSGSMESDLFGHCATFDNEGNIYTGGISFGIGFRSTDGAFDENYSGMGVDMVFQKFTPDARSLIFGTYVGGNQNDFPHSMIVTSNQELCVLGSSQSFDFPVSNTAIQSVLGGEFDITVIKLNRDATDLIGSTFLGGDRVDGQTRTTEGTNYGEEYRGEIILDQDEDILIASCSLSPDFPITAGAVQRSLKDEFDPDHLRGGQDAIVAKISSDVSRLIWSTFLGSEHMDTAYGLRESADGTIYVTGIAGESDFPSVGGGFMAWPGGRESAYVLGLSSDGQRVVYSTFWGTNQADRGYFLDIDEDDNINILGQTNGNITITPDVYNTGEGGRQFISCFSPDLSVLVFSTVIDGEQNIFGGGAGFVPVAFMVDLCNRIYFSGYYSTEGLPVSPDAILADVSDAFYLGVLDPGATGLNYGTYYGNADHVDGGTSRFDKGGIVYQGVCSCGLGPGGNILNTTPGAFATTQSMRCDLGVFKIDFELEVVTARASADPTLSGCAPLAIDFTYTGKNADEFYWDFDHQGATSRERDPSYTFEEPGTYLVELIAAASNSCNGRDTTYLEVVVVDGEPELQTVALCEDSQSITLQGQVQSGNYRWQDGSQQSTFVTNTPGTYWVETLIGDCVVRDSFIVVDQGVGIVMLPPDQLVCAEEFEIVADAAASTDLIWSTGSSERSITIVESGVYSVTATSQFGCEGVDEVFVDLDSAPPIPLGPDTVACDVETIVLDAEIAGNNLYEWQDGSSDPQYITDQSGTYSVTVTAVNGCTSSQEVQVSFGQSAEISLGDDVIECFEEEVNIMSEQLSGDIASYEWNTGDDTPNITVEETGVYVLTVVSTTNCPSADTVDVVISTIPMVDLGADTILCQGDDLVLAPEVTDAILLWNDSSLVSPTFSPTESGTIIVVADRQGCQSRDSMQVTFNPTPQIIVEVTGITCADSCNASINIEINNESDTYTATWEHGATTESIADLCPDLYVISAVNEFDCSDRQEIPIEPLDPIEYTLESAPVTCNGDRDGLIQIVDIRGGLPPYRYQLNDQAPTADPVYASLSGGMYTLAITDEAGCELVEDIDIYEPEFFDVWAGNDTTVRLGDTITINGAVEPLLDQLIGWTPGTYLFTPDSLSSVNVPLNTTVYTLTAVDTISGCVVEDQLVVRVDKRDRVVFPNIFSPNGDGNNDRFFITTDNSVSRGLWLRIYDRWGSLIMERLDYQPGDPKMGWDGTFNGKDAEQAVYVFATELLLVDGSKRVYTGDITLIR